MIERWLGETPLSTFLAEHYLQRPFALPDAAAEFTRYCTWETLDRVLAHERTPDVMVVRHGKLLEVPAPRSLEALQVLFAEGAGVVVRNAERQDPGLAELAAAFERDFRGPVVIQLFATPGGHSGFGWHYDVEEVFILQTAGTKEYFIRANTVNPHPVLENTPRDMQYPLERSPGMATTLVPGDWVYLPAGFWHRANAEQDSLSISLGVAPPTALDVLDQLRVFLLQSPKWRKRLPRAPEPSPTGFPSGDARAAMLAELGDDLRRHLQDDGFMQLLVSTLERQRLSRKR